MYIVIPCITIHHLVAKNCENNESMMIVVMKQWRKNCVNEDTCAQFKEHHDQYSDVYRCLSMIST